METDGQDRGSDGRMRGRHQGVNANSLLAKTSLSYPRLTPFLLPPFPFPSFFVTDFSTSSLLSCLDFSDFSSTCSYLPSCPPFSLPLILSECIFLYLSLSTSFSPSSHCFSRSSLTLSGNKRISRDQRGDNVISPAPPAAAQQ